MSIPRASILVLAAGLLTVAACARPSLLSPDPDLEAARRVCQNVPADDLFVCVEQQAMATLNPEVCRLLGIAVDDACLQSVYEAADDPTICDRLYLPGVIPTCKAYYAGPNHTPQLIRPAAGSS